MQARSYKLLFVAAFVASCGAAESPDAGRTAVASATAAPDLEAISKSIVTRTAEVKAGDVVAIIGGVRDLELLENIAVDVRAAGGMPLVMLGSERMDRRGYDDVSEKHDTLAPVWQKIVNSNANVVISVDYSETPALLQHVPPARIAARVKAGEEFDEIGLRRGVRIVDIGNGLYPTHSRAAQLGISRDELAKFFWSSLATDFTTLEQNAERVKNVLRQAREIHITTPNGTAVRFRLKPNAKIMQSAGTIPSEADIGKGVVRAAYLPAGEVFTLVEPGSAEGRIVADQHPYQGKMIPNLTINISKGRMTSFDAPSGIEHLKATYAAAPAGKDLVSLIDFGINPGIENTAGTSLRSWVPAGTVVLGVGSDIWAGGTNRTSFFLGPYLTNATVTADGREIVKDGKLIL